MPAAAEIITQSGQPITRTHLIHFGDLLGGENSRTAQEMKPAT